MTRQTKRIVGILAVLVLCVTGASLVALRSRKPATVAIADLAASAPKATASTDSSTAAASVGPTSSPTASAATTATPSATASAKAAAKPAAAKPKPPARKLPKSSTPIAPTVTRKSVKKGASVWNQSGIKASLADAGVSWDYDWANSPNVTAPKGVEFVPMIWGASSVNASSLATAKKNGKVLLGFNEPDMGGQANMTVDQALNLWPQLEATKMRLGSPAVAWGADQNGQWLDKFMAGAKQRGYRVDFITLHWYGSDFKTADAVNQLQTYIKATYAKYHKPIWITEYALMNFSGSPKLPTASNQAAFVTASTKMLQKLSYVERYAWFAFPTSTDGTDGTGLYRPGNIPTLVGKAYRVAGN